MRGARPVTPRDAAKTLHWPRWQRPPHLLLRGGAGGGAALASYLSTPAAMDDVTTVTGASGAMHAGLAASAGSADAGLALAAAAAAVADRSVAPRYG